jgi:hypothetical protein
MVDFMSEKKDRWDIKNAVIDNEEEYIRLTTKLYGLMLEFSLLAVKTFQEAKKEPLNILEINQIVTHEFDLTKAILSKPELIDIVSKQVEKEFGKD